MLNHADACSSDEVESSHARLIKRPLGGKKREVGVDTTPSSSSSILEINLEFPRCSSRRTAALLESGSNRRTTVTTVTTALSQVGRRTRNQTLVLHTATRLTATDRSSRA